MSRPLYVKPGHLFKQVSSGQFAPAYYFFGSEDYRITEAEKYVARQFLPDKQLITNYRRFNGRKIRLVDLLAELSALPMLGERQVISIGDIQSYKPTELERILKLLTPPDPNRVVIMSSPAARAPKRNSAFLRKMAGVALTVEFVRLSSQEAMAVIQRQLSQASLKIDRAALSLLVEITGAGRGMIDSECEKLICYKQPGETVSVEDLREIASGMELHSVFSLADEILAGDAGKVLKHLRLLIAHGNSPDTLLYFIEQHFLLLYLARNDRPLPPSRRWLAGKLRNQAARFDNPHLEQFLKDVADTTARLRRNSPGAELELESFVANVMTQTG